MGARLQRLRPRLHHGLRDRAPLSRRFRARDTSGSRASTSTRTRSTTSRPIADHVHWVGDKGPHAGNSRSDAAGGGHAHAGAMIYLGGDTWPAEYRSAIFMNNIHGHRTNIDLLARKGSGYAAAHGPDFLMANDSWSQMLNFRYGPDGSVYVIDWYDKNQCHSRNPDVHQQDARPHLQDQPRQGPLGEGRSAKVPSEQARRPATAPQRLVRSPRAPDSAGARTRSGGARAAQAHAEGERRRHAQAARALDAARHRRIDRAVPPRAARRTRASTCARGRFNCWSKGRNPSDRAVAKFAAMARQDARRSCVCISRARLQRVPAEKRWDAVAALLAHDEDAGDQNQPLMAGTPRSRRRVGHAARPGARRPNRSCRACSRSRCSGSPASRRRTR